MFKTNEQFAATNKSAIDSVQTVVNASLASAERLAALNLDTARALFADSAANVGALLAVKDPQGLAALNSTLAKPALEKVVAYYRSVYEIFSQSSSGLSAIVEAQAADLQKNFSTAIDQSLKSAPVGSEAIVAAVKSGLAAANSAYDTMTKAAKQATATVEANIASASTLMAKAA